MVTETWPILNSGCITYTLKRTHLPDEPFSLVHIKGGDNPPAHKACSLRCPNASDRSHLSDRDHDNNKSPEQVNWHNCPTRLSQFLSCPSLPLLLSIPKLLDPSDRMSACQDNLWCTAEDLSLAKRANANMLNVNSLWLMSVCNKALWDAIGVPPSKNFISVFVALPEAQFRGIFRKLSIKYPISIAVGNVHYSHIQCSSVKGQHYIFAADFYCTGEARLKYLFLSSNINFLSTIIFKNFKISSCGRSANFKKMALRDRCFPQNR